MSGIGLILTATMMGELFLAAAMSGALSSIRIRRSRGRVVLSGLDGIPFAIGLFLAVVVTGGALSLRDVLDWGWAPVASTALVAVGLAFGCRVRVEATREAAVCVRSVLWVVPWRLALFRHPIAWVDGWGDMSDPLAFHVGEMAPSGLAPSRDDEDGLFSVEVAWVLGEPTRADDLAEELNRAVRELSMTPSGYR